MWVKYFCECTYDVTKDYDVFCGGALLKAPMMVLPCLTGTKVCSGLIYTTDSQSCLDDQQSQLEVTDQRSWGLVILHKSN